MFTNSVPLMTFLDSTRSKALKATKKFGERLSFRLHSTQKYLGEVEEELETLKEEIRQESARVTPRRKQNEEATTR